MKLRISLSFYLYKNKFIEIKRRGSEIQYYDNNDRMKGMYLHISLILI
jgi:hypothetical protein